MMYPHYHDSNIQYSTPAESDTELCNPRSAMDLTRARNLSVRAGLTNRLVSQLVHECTSNNLDRRDTMLSLVSLRLVTIPGSVSMEQVTSLSAHTECT